MSEKLLIIDTDLFILLSAAGLVERVANLLGYPLENVRRLDAVPYQLQRGANFRKKYSDAVRELALSWCERVSPLTGAPIDKDRFQRLVDTENIEDRDAPMLAVVSEQPHVLLSSGDKRWMTAFGRSPVLGDVRAAMAGRIVCLEQVLQLLVNADGVAAVAAAFAPVRDGHQTLRVVFSEAGATDAAQCLGYIQSYLNDLIVKIGEPLLLKS